MFDFLKKKNDKNSNDEQIKEYFDNIKDASLFLDKSILAISSLFLGFLFNLSNSIINKNLEYIVLLKISLILLGITLFFVLMSYLLTIFQAKEGCNIVVGNKDNDCMFYIYDKLIDLVRIIYFVSFVSSIILLIVFYNLNI